MALEGKRINELTEVSKVDISSKLAIDTGGAEALSITLKNLIDSSGVGSVDIATTEKAGIVKPDGTTISVSSDGTISSSGSGFDFEGTKAEFDAAVAAGTITDDSVSLITDDVSGDNVATKAELQDRVAKAGDTMTGTLKMSGQNPIKLGTDDNYYYVQRAGNGQLSIFNKNNKGIFLQLEEAHAPFYWNGTNAFRLLTTADLQNIDYVVESQVNADGSWYRKYKSGWLEQGGLVASTSGATGTVQTFIKPYTDANYTLTATARGRFDLTFLITSKTATTFSCAYSSSGVGAYDWRTEGQGAN